ncbi:glycosyltransferase family 39 protein [uncultured Curtobacterium sp.]|uniref:glycosyltransferase family 39 protein n=1 Tax=uncultured Curtobacterium sp. TaxID=331964 RepID=UPI0025854DA0|nr:glycosyltransferase family 39 protein [uncultured Curtobacterium sp.]
MATDLPAQADTTTSVPRRVPEAGAPGRRERLVVAAVTALFGVLLVLWAALLPAFQAPDERAHFDAAVHLAIGDGWPDPGDMHLLRAVDQAGSGAGPSMGDLLRSTGSAEADTVNQMTQHPSTYYVLAGGVLRAVDFTAHRVDVDVVLVRLFSALFVLPLPALAWATVRRVTGSPRAAVVGAFAVLAVPELASIGASVSNDPPVVLFAATTVWLASRVLTGDARTRTAVALAVSLGVAILWKGTALPLIPFVAVVVLVGASRRTGVAARLLRALWVLAIAALIGAWWWLRNLVVFHTLQPSGFESIRPPQPFPAGTGPDPAAFADVSWTTIARTFWGSFGGRAQWILSPVVFETATVLALGAVLVWGFRRAPGLRVAVALAVLPLTVFVFQTANAWGSYRSTTFIGATQGRYYFPALLVFVALSAIAWRRAVGTDRARRRFATVVSAIAVALALYGPFFTFTWIGESGRTRVTSAGLAALAASTPAPVPGLVAAWLVALVLAVTAVLLSRGVPSVQWGPGIPGVPSVQWDPGVPGVPDTEPVGAPAGHAAAGDSGAPAGHGHDHDHDHGTTSDPGSVPDRGTTA